MAILHRTSDAKVMETLRVFRVAVTVACTVTVEVPTVATAHTVALAVLVSPSEERNLDFPYFMVTDPITGHVYYVNRGSYV